MPKVTGISSATAIVAVRPGIAPMMMPPSVPRKMAMSGAGARSDIAASVIICIIAALPLYRSAQAALALASEPAMSENVNSSNTPSGTGTLRNRTKTP